MRPERGEWAATKPSRSHQPAVASAGELHRSVDVQHHPSSAGLIRQELTADLPGYAARFGTEFAQDAVAVATELVGNAVRHARPLPGGIITVEWRGHPGGLEIRVTDGGSPHTPVVRRVAPLAPAGRGLTIVSKLSARWGVSSVGRGRCVWAWLGEVSRATQVAS